MRGSRLLTIPLLLACGSLQAQSEYGAVVDGSYRGVHGALVEGVPRFTTIGQAIAEVPADNRSPFVILIRAGRYYEKITVDRPFVHLVGEGRESTVLTYDESAGSLSQDGNARGTEGSFTLRIIAPDFVAEQLTVENSFDYPGNAAKSDDDPSKVANPQAVAVMTSGASDRTVFRDCTISGYQDTLFLDAGRHYIERCRILGHVDFIFGAGQAVFEESEIISRNRANKNPTGYITAPSTSGTMPYGFLFINSRLLKETDELPAGSVRLGRPWHPSADSTVNGSAVFVDCFMDDHIGPEGYARISSRNKRGERVWFEVGPNSRFFEFGNHGPGARTSRMRPTLTAEAARWYTAEHVLDGWTDYK